MVPATRAAIAWPGKDSAVANAATSLDNDAAAPLVTR
jgi:hypothetical protein